MLGFALFIIGCVAAAGHLNGVVAGGLITGFAGTSLLINVISMLCSRKLQTKLDGSRQAVFNIFFTIMGALAIAGALTPGVAGWCVLVPALVGVGISVMIGYCVCCAGCCAAVMRGVGG